MTKAVRGALRDGIAGPRGGDVMSERVTAGRASVDRYRMAHAALHRGRSDAGVPAAHTALLSVLLKALEAAGYESSKEALEDRTAELLAAFFADSELENMQALGFASREDFAARATDQDSLDMEALWR